MVPSSISGKSLEIMELFLLLLPTLWYFLTVIIKDSNRFKKKKQIGEVSQKYRPHSHSLSPF